MHRLSSALAAALAVCALASPAFAQTETPSPTPTSAPATPETPDQSTGEGAPAPAPAATAVSSEVSIVGDFRYETNFRDPSLDRVREEETELAVTGYLSPWSRADFFLSHHDIDKFDLEEGFLTLTELPWDLKARVGKFKMPFGKLNPVHPEGWAFINAPLVMTSLLGSDEGWNDYAVELSGFVPVPVDWLTTATVSASNGDGASTLQRGAMGSARLTTYVPVSDEAGVELGLSGASQFSQPVAGLDRRSLVGADLRYRHRTDPSTSYTLLLEGMGLATGTGFPWGAYLSADYQFLTNHDVDLRLDYTDIPGSTDVAKSISATYGLSLFETTRFKVQFQHTVSPQPEERVIAQTVFVLGPHKHALTF